MSEIFVDTSGWYGLADPRQPEHASLATALEDRIRGGALVVTTNLVVAETHALLVRRSGRRAALRFFDEVNQEPILIETSSPALEARARLDWLVRFDDQEFTLTDAVSFAVMTQRGMAEALTLDQHFAAAGFIMVPSLPLPLRESAARYEVQGTARPVGEEDWRALP